MPADIQKTKEEINYAAFEMITLNPVTDKARIETLRATIADKMLEISCLKQRIFKGNTEMIWCPYMYTEGENRYVNIELFFTVLAQLLAYNENGFKYKGINNDGKKTAFLTAFSYVMERRRKNYDIKEQQQQAELILDRGTGTKNYSDEREYNSELPEGNSEEQALNTSFLIADTMQDYFRLLDSSNRKEKDYYQAFFTFDVTRAVKQEIVERIVLEKNSAAVFPALLLNLLQYLMSGEFFSLLNVLDNPLREGVNLGQRQLLLQDFLDVSNTTVIKYNAGYVKILKQLGFHNSTHSKKKAATEIEYDQGVV